MLCVETLDWIVEVVVGFLVALMVVVVVVIIALGWLVGVERAFGRRATLVLFSTGGTTDPARKVNTSVTIIIMC